MELIIQILALFIVINCIIKLSFWKLWQVILFGVLCGVSVIWMCQFAVLQSKTQLADYLKNSVVLQDMAVLITIESTICFACCFAMMREMYGKKRQRWRDLLYWYPSLLLFPVLFYLLTQTIFALPGKSFTAIAYGLAGGVSVGLPLLSYLLRHLYSEVELRLELHFLVSLFVCIIGLITTVNGHVTYAATRIHLDGKALAWSLLLFGMAFLIGFIWSRVKWRVGKRKRNKSTK